MFEEAFLGCFFPREFREAEVKEFLNLKQRSMTVQEYGLKFTSLSRYALDMVADMRGRMGLYADGLNKGTKKDGRGAMLVSDMDIGRLTTYAQQADEERQQDRKETKSKKVRTSSHEVGKRVNENGSHFQTMPSSTSEPAPRNEQGSHNFRA